MSDEESSPPHRVRALILGVLVPTGLLVAATITVFTWRDRLPPELVLHWGAEGPTRWGSFAEFLAVPLTLGLLSVAIGGTVAMRTGRSALTRRLTAGLTLGTAAVFSGLLWSTAGLQVDRDEPVHSGSLGGWLALVLLGSLAAGSLAAAAAGADPLRPASRGPRESDARLTPQDAHRTWVGRTPPAHPRTSAVMGIASLVAGLLLGWRTGHWWWAAVFVLLAASVGLFSAFVVRIDATALQAWTVAGWPRVLRLDVREIERAEVTVVSPWRDFGGWGLRRDVHGRTGLVTRTAPALAVHGSEGRQVVITLPDAHQAAALVNTLVSERPSDPEQSPSSPAPPR